MASSVNQASITKKVVIDGQTYTESPTVSAAVKLAGKVTPTAAQPGVQTTGGTTTAGNITMTNGAHGIITGQRVDVYWSGGSLLGATVGTVSGTTVPITATGTYFPATISSLPANTTAVQVAPTTTKPMNITGNNLLALVLAVIAGGDTSSYSFSFWNGSSYQTAFQIQSGQVHFYYNTNNVTANPLAGDTVTQVYYSTSCVTTPKEMNAYSLTSG